ncbi:MAG: DNA-directed RNA polymerase subunit N [Sulfolobales archaeon]
MIIPVRCFTCGYPVSRHWEEFSRRIAAGEDPKKVLDDLGVKRYCCRRILLAHVPLVNDIIYYSRKL